MNDPSHYFTGFQKYCRLRMAIRYLGEELGHAYMARVSGEDSVTIRLRPRKFIEYHGRAGRTESG